MPPNLLATDPQRPAWNERRTPASTARRAFCLHLAALGAAGLGRAGSAMANPVALPAGRPGAESAASAPLAPDSAWPGLRVIDERQTRFGRLYVVEVGRRRYLAYGPGTRFVFQSGIDLDRPQELLSVYTRVMMLGMVYAPSHEQVVQIGVGAGNMAGYAVRTFPTARVHAIDIDPQALELGARHFGLAPHPRLHVHVEDGRRWLARSRERFDVIMLDAYDDKGIPAALRDASFFRLVAERLAPGGVALQNVLPQQVDVARLDAAMRSAFSQCDVYRANGNQVFVAYQGLARAPAELQARARELDARLRPTHSLEELLTLRMAG